MFTQLIERGRLAKCTSNSRQISAALLSCAGDSNGVFPRWISGREPVPKGARPGQAGGTDSGTTWMQRLVDDSLLEKTSRVWKCPNDVSYKSQISYAMNANVAGHHLASINRPGDTILLAERYDKVAWKVFSLPTYIAAPNARNLTTGHANKIVCSFVDGHVEVLELNNDAGNLQPPDSRWILKD